MSAFKKIAIALGVVLLIILIGNWGINVYVNKKVPALISEKNMDYAGLDEMVPLLKLSAEELDRVLIEIVQKAQKNWYL